MKRYETLSVGQIIERAIANTGNRDEYYRQQVCYMWQEVVGPAINRLTIRRFVDRDVLHVYLASSTLKNELQFVTSSLVTKLNDLAGRDVISKIVLH